MKPDPAAGPSRDEFEGLYADHRQQVWAVAYSRWTDPDIAMDITQEVFCRLWRQFETGEVLQNPRAWLMRVARNLAEDYAKSAFRRNGTQSPEQMDGIGSAARSPLETLERRETFDQIRALLDELTAADREILTLRYAFDHDSARIAEILNLPVTAVHMRLSRARKRLEERLTAHGVRSVP